MSALEKLLTEEKDLVVHFLDVLRKEQAALVEADAGILQMLGDKKLGLIDRLNQVEAGRIALITLPPGKDSMLHWLTQHPEESGARALWLKIISLARVARQMHQMNGELIAMHLAKTNEALSVLIQKQKDIALYSSDGQSFTGTGSRIVDLA